MRFQNKNEKKMDYLVIKTELIIKVKEENIDFLYTKIPILLKNLGHRGGYNINPEQQFWGLKPSAIYSRSYKLAIYWEISNILELPSDEEIREEIGYWFKIISNMSKEMVNEDFYFFP